jgi:hypothetical protein
MKNWKAIVGVVLVFVLGALAGALVVHRVYQRKLRAIVAGRQPLVAPEWIVRRMSWELGLTPAQRLEVLAIVRDTQRQLRETRVQVDPQSRVAFQQLEQRLNGVLTPEQQATFAKLVAERKARWPLLQAPPSPPRQP